MTTLKLLSLVNSKSAGIAAVSALCNAMGNGICITDSGGRALFGDAAIVGVPSAYRAPVTHEGTTLGFVLGALPQANALALLLSHLAARESEGSAR